MSMDWLRDPAVLFRIVMLLGTAVQTMFVLVYLTRPWRDSPVSRALMNKSATLCLFLWALDVHFINNVPEPLWVWIGLALLLTWAVSRQFWVLTRVNHYAHSRSDQHQ